MGKIKNERKKRSSREKWWSDMRIGEIYIGRHAWEEKLERNKHQNKSEIEIGVLRESEEKIGEDKGKGRRREIYY